MSDLDHCLRYLQQQHVLTLCTGQGDSLWAANCFYVLDEQHVALWLMTQPDTRHGELMRRNPRVAGTVTTATRSVMKIQGVQFSGEILQPQGERLQQGISAYQQQFPVARAMNAPLWEIRLDTLKMTDNTLGFGKKIHWSRNID